MKFPIKTFFLVFGCALLVRLLWLSATELDSISLLTGDSGQYIGAAQSLMDHGVYSLSKEPPYKPFFNRPPGFPVYLTLFLGSSSFPGWFFLLSQALLGALSAGVLFLLAWTLLNNVRLALAAGLSLTVDIVTLVYTPFVLSEPLFLFLWLSGLFFLYGGIQTRIRFAWVVMAGVLIGMASLVRPISVYFSLFVAPFILWRLKNQKKLSVLGVIAIFFLVSSIAPVLWALRNQKQSGHFFVSTNPHTSFYSFRLVMTEMINSGIGRPEAEQRVEKKFLEAHPEEFSSELEEILVKGKWAVSYLASRPGFYFKPLMYGTFKLFAGMGLKAMTWQLTADPRYDPMASGLVEKKSILGDLSDLLRQHPFLFLFFFLYGLLIVATYVFSAFGIHVLFREKGMSHALFIAAPALYLILVSIGPEAHSRYRIPIMPTLFVLASIGIGSFINRFKSLKSSEAI